MAYGHKKIYQVENENVGTQAAHKSEVIAERGLRKVHQMRKTAPYRKVQRLEHKTDKLNIKASYQKALHDNPKLKSNILSRKAQKRKIKKQYAKTKRDAQRAGKTLKKTGQITEKIIQKTITAVINNPHVLLIIGGLFLLVIVISSVATSCSAIVSGLGSSLSSATYLADEADINNAELNYTEWETDLRMEINSAESDNPGYDQYRYQIGSISHDPYKLMAFLTAVYKDFQYADIESVLQQIFNEQYQLTISPSTETRYRENEDGDLIPYSWHVLTIRLTSRPFTDVIFSHMNDEQAEHYGLLMQSKGGRQFTRSPFDFNWSYYITDYFGYRMHPMNGTKNFHKGIDISAPVGTEIYATHSGTVTFAGYSGDYGYVAVIDDGNGLVTKYAHCDSLSVITNQIFNAGDVIALSGNTGLSTGPHLHYEIIKDGVYLNPVFFAMSSY